MKTYVFTLPTREMIPFTTHDFPNALSSLGQWAVMTGYDFKEGDIKVTVTDWAPKPDPAGGTVS